jgi:cytochrome P450
MAMRWEVAAPDQDVPVFDPNTLWSRAHGGKSAMSIAHAAERPAHELRNVPPSWLLRFFRDPVVTLETIGRQSGGRVSRLNWGVLRPYLVTHPDHIQHVLRKHSETYQREGMMWKPLRRLVGQGIGSDGPPWKVSRLLLQKVFSHRYISSITDQMAVVVNEAIDELGRRSQSAGPVDANAEMTRIVQRAVIKVFFGDRISLTDAERIGPAIQAATSSLGPRMLLPFVPHSVRLPGDAAFRRAVEAVDEVMLPLVRSARDDADGSDVVSLLLRARDEHGKGLDDRQIRNDLVAMFFAGTESTAAALTWLFVVLESHPHIAAKLSEEIERVVGAGPVSGAHVEELRYTKMVLQELLRVYSVGWIIPRTAAADDAIEGVRIRKGATILISPYLTHRLPDFWPDPHVFDPERFAPDEPRHPFAYIPFGAGPHQCLGSHFFTIESQLIMAALLSRLHPKVHGSSTIKPKLALMLTPNQQVAVTLTPRNGR